MRRMLRYLGLGAAIVALASLALWYWVGRTPTHLPTAIFDVLMNELYSGPVVPNDGAMFVFSRGNTFFVDVVFSGPQGRRDAYYQIEGSQITKLDRWFPAGHAAIYPGGISAKLCYSKQFRARESIQVGKL